MQRIVRSGLAGLAALAGLVLLVPVVLLALPFWAVAGLQRAARAWIEARRPATTPWQEMMEYEPEIGWKPKGGLDVHAAGTPIFHVRTDADGWRGPDTTIEDAGIVVYGDSFAFGHGADEDAFFANLPGEPRMKAIGANGYAMVQGLLWMRRHAPRLAGKTVVWMIYYGNDLYENIQPNMGRYRIPFVRGAAGPGPKEIVTGHVSPERWPFVPRAPYVSLLAEICTPGPLSDRVFEAADWLIRQAAELCAGVGARLLVVGIPHVDVLDPVRGPRMAASSPDPGSYDPALPDRRLREISESHGAGFLSLQERQGRGDYLDEDVHWTRAGHRRVAARIREAVDGLDSTGTRPRAAPRRGIRAASV